MLIDHRNHTCRFIVHGEGMKSVQPGRTWPKLACLPFLGQATNVSLSFGCRIEDNKDDSLVDEAADRSPTASLGARASAAGS